MAAAADTRSAVLDPARSGTYERISQALMQATNLAKVYGKAPNEFHALRDVSVEIGSGDNVAIVGKSGSGKSTLMHILAALDRPTSGELWFDNRRISDLGRNDLATLRNQAYAFIFQQFFLMPRMKVLDNVTLQLKIRGIGAKERAAHGMEALRAVGLEDKAKNKANDLSGGQKQRVAIARALVAQPRVLFADEPTGNLDSKTGHEIIELLFDINQRQGITLIIVTHDMEFAQMCQRRIEIADGQVVQP